MGTVEQLRFLFFGFSGVFMLVCVVVIAKVVVFLLKRRKPGSEGAVQKVPPVSSDSPGGL